jgi:type VI secretion system protein ImpC
MAEQQAASPSFEGVTLEGNDFSKLLKKEFKPKSDEARSAVEAAVQTLAQQALSHTTLIGTDTVQSIEAMIAAIDRKLSEQVNAVLHHPDFQKLESAWRGLHYMVNNTETDEFLKIRVMAVSKQDLGKTLKRYKGTAWDQSPLFKKLYEEEYGQFGGEPFGAIVGDYHFDHSPPDVELLGEMSKIAASAHCPFITGAAPSVMQMESWSELANPRDLTKIFLTPEYAAWRSLRESDDARYLAMCIPRFLGRLPWCGSSPVEAFNFEEDTVDKYAWCNAAYAMATSINRSFRSTGGARASAHVESGGAVENHRPAPSRRRRRGRHVRPDRVDRREAKPRRTASLAMIHRKNSDFAAFIGAQSLQKPFEYDDPDATGNAALAARLPYLFACNRFAHYLKCMVRDKIGSFKSRDAMERWLNKWILNYVDGDPTNSPESVKAQRPLAAAEVVVEEVEGAPGYYQSKFFLKPHYQLEGLTVSLRLVTKLPSEKG